MVMELQVIIVLCILCCKIFFSSAEQLGTLEWWQSGVIYQIFPRSFKDSNGDGIGDLKGIEEKAEYLKDLGISAIWLSPIFESPMVDFGYDVSDYYKIADVFGKLEDFKSLKQKLDSLNIRIILDLVPNHTSDQSDWFKKSVQRIDPFTNYYVWKDPTGWNGSIPIPPNNWVSLFNGPAWKYNEERKQFYLHQFAEQQPDLNYRCDEVVDEMERIILFWLDQGVDGFRIDSVAYILEHPEFPSEPINKQFSSDVLSHDSLIHMYSKDWSENYALINHFEEIIQRYSQRDGKHRLLGNSLRNFLSIRPINCKNIKHVLICIFHRIVIHEAYTSFENTMKFYGKVRGRHMPFNFLLITDIDDHSNARNFSDVILKWLNNMPEYGWPNWVIGNHDNSRVATRFDPELVDGMNMINLLLPGTAITYNGEEIGMTDGKVRWDQTLDPGALNAGFNNFRKFTRDPARTPFQWDSTHNAGFTTSKKAWLPVNSNYWNLNLAQQIGTDRSNYNTYKKLTTLRSHPTIQHGVLKIYVLSEWLLAFVRKLDGHDSFIVILNLGSEEEDVVLRSIVQDLDLPDSLSVYVSSVNSEYEMSYVLRTRDSGFKMRPKSALVLTTSNVTTAKRQNAASWYSSATAKYLEPLFFFLFYFFR